VSGGVRRGGGEDGPRGLAIQMPAKQEVTLLALSTTESPFKKKKEEKAKKKQE
jgi:hypothetical protein